MHNVVMLSATKRHTVPVLFRHRAKQCCKAGRHLTPVLSVTKGTCLTKDRLHGYTRVLQLQRHSCFSAIRKFWKTSLELLEKQALASSLKNKAIISDLGRACFWSDQGQGLLISTELAKILLNGTGRHTRTC